MSGQTAVAVPVQGSQAVLERIQVSVMSTAKPVSISPMQLSDDGKKEQQKTTETWKEQSNISNTTRVWTSLVSGAIAGAVAKTTIAPLDRTKINFQISKSPYSVRAAVEFLSHCYKTEGLWSLWRGNSATMIRIVPYSAIQFTAYEQWKRFLRMSRQKDFHGLSFLAGSLAGVTAQSLTYPLDVARARMAVTHRNEYKTLNQVFVRMYRIEGVGSYYRGFVATILGVIPYAGCSFFTFETLKEFMAPYTSHSPGLATLSALCCGAVAGVVGQTSSYPMDIIRRRMQTSAIKGNDYTTMYQTALKIYSEEGKMAFFKGLSMNWIKGPVAVGISYTINELIRDRLRGFIS